MNQIKIPSLEVLPLTRLLDNSVPDEVGLVGDEDGRLGEEETLRGQVGEDELGLVESTPVIDSHHHDKGVRRVEAEEGVQGDLTVLVVYEEDPRLLFIDHNVDLLTDAFVCDLRIIFLC